MANEELRRQLQDRCLPWEVGQRHGGPQGEKIRWLPVAHIAAGRMRIGLSEAGLWVTANDRSVAELEPGSPAIFLLPVLELQVADFKSDLTDGLQAKGLGADLAAKFPFEAIVTTALNSNSEYWTKLALNWIPQISMTPAIRGALQEVARSGPTQAIRHSALRTIRD